ncbi:hypothetical protein [Bremerella sp.]|uniref:hypothetical protein n=1 Tax=Bremerella sp. TaxID=2795602 RepID=UPI00391A5CC4
MSEFKAFQNRLSASDPSLAFLASQAAIELDNRILGRHSTLTAVGQLAERLENATESVGEKDRRSLMDPTTVSMFSNAIAASESKQVCTLEELASEAWRIATTLHESVGESGADEERLKQMRTFCVYLAESAIGREASPLEAQDSTDEWRW